MLSLFPYRDYDAIERNYGALWTIFTYSAAADRRAAGRAPRIDPDGLSFGCGFQKPSTQILLIEYSVSNPTARAVPPQR